jgi:DNA-binding transcriptional LysR family regulator
MAVVLWDDRMRRRLRLRDLDVLMSVMQAGSMGRATARLNMSQPAISKAIADLERALGVRLLDRSRQGVEPTPYGRALIKRGIAVFDELRQGVQDIEFLSDPTAGEIRIGSTEVIAAAIVMPVVDRLTQQYPKMAFHVVIGDAGRLYLYPQLAERNIELFMSRIPGPVADEYSAEILFHDTLVVAVGASSPLARRRKIALADLLDEPWTLFPADSYFGTLQAGAFRAYGLAPPRAAVWTTSPSLRSELLATGRFLTILPGFSLRLPRRRLTLAALPVELSKTRMPVAIVTLKKRALSPLAQLFIERVRAVTKPLAKD